jgi:hypothetical protein
MKMKNNLLKWSLFVFVFAFAGCETMDLDQLENPSQPSENLLDPVYAFNYVQLQLPDFVDSGNSFTQRIIRQMAMSAGNTYDNAFAPVNSNNNWNLGYNLLNSVKLMEPKALANREYYALGAAKVIRVYVLMTMVDIYGDIPYSEALMGNANLTPRFDNDADVYKGLLTELDNAIVMLARTDSNSNSKIQDLYYGSQANWITLANTLKLKMYCTARLAGSDLGVVISDKINEILVADDYINEESEDFAFRYGNSRFTPNTRHPLYNDQYEAGGGAYIANYMMWAMSTEKNFAVTGNGIQPSATVTYDPRTPFYFCKQDLNPSNEDDFTLPRRARPDHYNDDQYDSFYFAGSSTTPNRTPYLVSNWCGQTGLQSDGYWGRDHGDNSGIPPDADKRTVGGIYPIGGAYGLTGSVQTGGDKGALGAGIMPMILSSYVHFMLAEVALELPAAVPSSITALGELEAGIRASIKKTVNLIPDFPYGTNGNASAPSSATLLAHEELYVTYVKDKYTLASTNKLELIIKEYFLAAWGNGIEPYNAYRRTGYPSNLQPTLELASGSYYYCAYYPSDSTVNNPNAPANNRTRRVFWDKAGLTLH